MKCPKRYGSYDQRIADCPKCLEALLYQRCRNEKCKNFACAGWNSDGYGGPNCCTYYTRDVRLGLIAKIVLIALAAGLLFGSHYMGYRLRLDDFNWDGPVFSIEEFHDDY